MLYAVSMTVMLMVIIDVAMVVIKVVYNKMMMMRVVMTSDKTINILVSK